MTSSTAYQDLLASLRRGTLLADLANELAVLTAAVKETGKKGTITLVLTLEPQKNDPGVVTISDKITLKEPKDEVPATIVYITADNEITRRDPRQPELPEGVTQFTSTQQQGAESA